MEYIAASRPDYAHVARRLKGKVNPGYLRVGRWSHSPAPSAGAPTPESQRYKSVFFEYYLKPS